MRVWLLSVGVQGTKEARALGALVRSRCKPLSPGLRHIGCQQDSQQPLFSSHILTANSQITKLCRFHLHLPHFLQVYETYNKPGLINRRRYNRIAEKTSHSLWPVCVLVILAAEGGAPPPNNTHTTVYVGHLSPRTERRDVEELVSLWA
jgi:hypothetical protein